MKRFTLFLAFLAFIGTLSLNAQTREISGLVTSVEDGQPMPGVSVVVKGTTIGTTTDVDGQYILNVPADANTLVYSFVGMSTLEIPIGQSSVVNATLEPDVLGLDEVIVTAYGIQRKEAKTGAVSEVRAEEIESIPVTSPEKLIQGRMAGVQVNSATGQPGAANQIRIRGFSSINAGNEPLYVIDGVPVASGNYSYFTSTGNILASINPNDIESITVLKDAAAASVYGSRAANGVILINTKSGKSGTSKVNFRAKYGVTSINLDQDYRMMTADEIYRYNRTALSNANINPANYPEPLLGAGFYASANLPGDVRTYDWMDAAFRDAQYQEYDFSLTGGDQDTKYFTSASYTNQEGIMPATGLERYGFRANLDQNVGKKFKMGTKISGTYLEQQDRPNENLFFANPFWAAVNLLPWHPAYNEDGTYNFRLPSNANSNFLASAEHDDQWEKQYRVLANGYAQYELIEGLTIKTSNSAEILDGEGRRWWDPQSDAPGVELGTLQTSNTKLERFNTTNTINYMTSFAGDHDFRILLGQEALKHTYQTFYSYGERLGNRLPYLSNTTIEGSGVDYSYARYTLLSFFGILDYDFKDTYVFTASLRGDGHSRFGEDTRWGTFYSVGASWNLHKEAFLSGLTEVNQLKLRFSYGTSGNAAIGNFDQYGTYASISYAGAIGLAPDNLANPALGWELNNSFNVGVDYALFQKVTGSIEYYKRITSEMLLDVPLSRTTGFDEIRRNVGELSNEGVEASVNINLLRGVIDWNVKGNIAYNQIELLDLAGEEEIADGFWRRYRLGGGFSDYYVYDWAGVNPANGEGLWYDEEGNVTDNFNQARRVYKGQVEPKFWGGFGTDISWRGLTLSAFFEYKTGQYFYAMESRYTLSDGFNFGANQNALLLDYWKAPGDVVPNPKPIAGNGSNTNAWGTSRYLEKGDYLRFKDLTISYNLPKDLVSRINISNVRIFASGTNLFTSHDVSYWDPERDVNGGGYIVYPQSRTITFGLDLGF